MYGLSRFRKRNTTTRLLDITKKKKSRQVHYLNEKSAKKLQKHNVSEEF